jgi:glycosyltransferase involved in cell wall biosynthesis
MAGAMRDASRAAARPTKLRLLHVIPSFTTGGVPIRLVNIANRLGADFRHLVLALDAVTSAAERLLPNVDHELVTLAIDKTKPFGNLLRFHRALAALRPDLLLTYNWGAIDWAIVNSAWRVCRHLHFEDGFGPAEMNRILRRRVLGRRYGLHGAERIIVPSHALERIARDVWKIPAHRILYLANGIDLRRFGQVAAPAIDGFERTPGERVIGTVAPLRPEKNLGRLIRAFARLPADLAVRLVIVGDGAERPALAAEAARCGVALRVHFAGATPEPERALHAFDLFAISSETEQMPISVLEAMAAGRAIAGVAVGDIARMVAEENRPFIVPRDDEAALADAMARLLVAPDRARAIGAANKAKARACFDQETMFAAYDRLYRGLPL